MVLHTYIVSLLACASALVSNFMIAMRMAVINRTASPSPYNNSKTQF